MRRQAARTPLRSMPVLASCPASAHFSPLLSPLRRQDPLRASPVAVATANMTLDSAEECGKLFIGGLSWDTTADRLKEYFSRYGEVIDCAVMKNPETGRSRGFGFISFRDPGCVQLVLSGGPHFLDGRTIDPKSCNAKGAQKGKREAKMMNYPKVFLGGLPSDVNETLLRDFFSKYGKVVEVVIMYNQERKSCRGNGFRGFGFLSFDNDESVSSVVAEHYVTINGKKVEVKRAEPREKSSPASTLRIGSKDLGNFVFTLPGEASAQSFWCPNLLSGSSASSTSDSLTAPVTSGLLTPISVNATWASAHPPLTSIPWVPAVSPSVVPLLSTGSGLFGTASAFPHFVQNPAFNSQAFGANLNSGQYDYSVAGRISLPPFVAGSFLAANPALATSSMPIGPILPSTAVRQASCAGTRVVGVSAFPALESCLSASGLRLKSQVQGYHPYRRM